MPELRLCESCRQEKDCEVVIVQNEPFFVCGGCREAEPAVRPAVETPEQERQR